MAKFQIIGKKKSFTLVEMLVTIFILVVMLGVASVSLSTGRGSSTVSSQADEIIGLVDERKSFAYGPERERASDYVLIIKTSGNEEPFCNKGLTSKPNKLTKNQYIICSTTEKNIAGSNISDENSIFSRVRAGGLNSDLTITKSTEFATANVAIINIRTYDGQTGYDLKYCDKDSACSNPTIKLDQSGISKT